MYQTLCKCDSHLKKVYLKCGKLLQLKRLLDAKKELTERIEHKMRLKEKKKTGRQKYAKLTALRNSSDAAHVCQKRILCQSCLANYCLCMQQDVSRGISSMLVDVSPHKHLHQHFSWPNCRGGPDAGSEEH